MCHITNIKTLIKNDLLNRYKAYFMYRIKYYVVFVPNH